MSAELLTTAEAAELLGVSLKTVENRVFGLKLTPAQGNGASSWRFTRAEIERRIAERAGSRFASRHSGSVGR